VNNIDRLEIDKFLSSISLWSPAYSAATFSYIAIKGNELSSLVYGRLFLIPKYVKALPQRFESKNILANTFLISDLGITFQEFITQILDSKLVKTPDGELIFSIAQDGKLSAYFNEFHMDGINSGKRVSYLRLSGENRHTFLRQPEIDWELKGAAIPFDSIVDLMTEYSLLGCDTSDAVNIEIISNSIVEIDINSKVVGDTAEPAVFLANSLDQNKCSIGYRVFFNGRVHARGSLSSNDFVWDDGGDVQHGVGTLKIPIGASIHCVATYASHAQHQYWIADLNNLPNSRRVLLEECDTDLSVLKDYLFNEKKQRKESRDFEIGVAQLMWMLGYSASQPGASPRTSDAVDIIATTAKGSILLIECTTGLLKAENKLAKLIARTEMIKRRMQNGHRHLVICPMIVTSMTREEVRSEVNGALDLGIIVVTKDELAQMISQTITITDSDVHFDQLIRTVQPKQQFNY
jgi:hypothetical protein